MSGSFYQTTKHAKRKGFISKWSSVDFEFCVKLTRRKCIWQTDRHISVFLPSAHTNICKETKLEYVLQGHAVPPSHIEGWCHVCGQTTRWQFCGFRTTRRLLSPTSFPRLCPTHIISSVRRVVCFYPCNDTKCQKIIFRQNLCIKETGYFKCCQSNLVFNSR